MMDDEEFEEVKETFRGLVILFKTVWDEIEHQFSGLPKEERHRIFSVVAPSITDIFGMALREGEIEDIAKPDRKRKKRR